MEQEIVLKQDYIEYHIALPYIDGSYVSSCLRMWYGCEDYFTQSRSIYYPV